MTFEEIRKSLSTLTKAQLNDLIKHASFFANGKAKDVQSDFAQIIILFAKKHVGIPGLMPESMQNKLNEAATALEALCIKLQLDRGESMKLSKLLIEGAVLSLKDQEIVISLKTLLNLRLTNPQSLYNQCFPGYTVDLLRKFVLNARQTNKVYARKYTGLIDLRY